MKVYIAISIHGTNKFITATKDVKDKRYVDVKFGKEHPIKIGKRTFYAVPSSLPQATSRGNKPVKLVLPTLALNNTVATSGHGPKVIDNPILVLATFNALQLEGWQVDVEQAHAFAKHHNLHFRSSSRDLYNQWYGKTLGREE